MNRALPLQLYQTEDPRTAGRAQHLIPARGSPLLPDHPLPNPEHRRSSPLPPSTPPSSLTLLPEASELAGRSARLQHPAGRLKHRQSRAQTSRQCATATFLLTGRPQAGTAGWHVLERTSHKMAHAATRRAPLHGLLKFHRAQGSTSQAGDS